MNIHCNYVNAVLTEPNLDKVMKFILVVFFNILAYAVTGLYI